MLALTVCSMLKANKDTKDSKAELDRTSRQMAAVQRVGKERIYSSHRPGKIECVISQRLVILQGLEVSPFLPPPLGSRQPTIAQVGI